MTNTYNGLLFMHILLVVMVNFRLVYDNKNVIRKTSYLATSCQTSIYIGCMNTEALRTVCISSAFPCVLSLCRVST